MWIAYLMLALVAGMVAGPNPVGRWIVASFLLILIVLGGLIVFACQERIRVLMTQ
jgi:uncharacterized membrane protein YhaH (DUF805 family)